MGGGAVFSMTIARCNFRRRKLNFNAIFLGSSSNKRDAEATQADARTRPQDTFSCFAILPKYDKKAMLIQFLLVRSFTTGSGTFILLRWSMQSLLFPF